MKKIIKLLTAIVLILSLLSISVTAEEFSSWYIKRRDGGVLEFPRDAEELKEYNCYYLDEASANESEHRIYLTFDAGYANKNFEAILDTLRDEKVPAAFFLLDNIILKNTNLVNRLEEEGHLVCNHTKNHKNLSSATKEEIAKDLSALEAIYKEKTGREMSKYFRFPEGKYSLEAVKKVSELGYTTVFWSFGYDDWDNARQMSSEKAKNKILSCTHDGEILLLHPTSKTNALILRDLIHEWRNMGYTFGTLDELER